MIGFCKFHGFGNDYIVLEKSVLKDIADIGEFSRKICHRHTGVGGDGIAVVEKSDADEADFYCDIINPDGSRAGFSGNGTRCAVAYLYYKNFFADENLKLRTKSGVKNYQFLRREENTFWFSAELGKPKFAAEEIPFAAEENLSSISNFKFQISNSDKPLSITALNVGNPVCAIFVEDFELNWRRIGAQIESHPRFPERTNVVFVKILNEQNVEIRIWERGAGETSSSGTCSIAAAVASAFTGKTERKVSVHAEGGTTECVWREDGEMLITGRADLAFCGEYFFNLDAE